MYFLKKIEDMQKKGYDFFLSVFVTHRMICKEICIHEVSNLLGREKIQNKNIRYVYLKKPRGTK